MKPRELKHSFIMLSLPEQVFSTDEKINAEEKKLALYTKLNKHLTTLIPHLPKPLKEKIVKPTRFLLLRQIIYYFLLAFGFLENAVGSFLFAQNLLVLIPFLSNPIIIVGSVFITVVSGILFYAFEASLFKEALGIPANAKERRSLIQSYTKQVALLEQINKQLSDISFITTINQTHYQQLAQIALLMNQDIAAKQQALGKYQESLPKKLARYLVTSFGALMTGAGTYFMATSLLTLVSASLVTTPLGWGLIGLMIIAGLGFYLSMQGKGMVELINPEYTPFKTLKNNLNNFECKTEHDFHVIDQLQTQLKSTQNPLSDKSNIPETKSRLSRQPANTLHQRFFMPATTKPPAVSEPVPSFNLT